MAISTVLVQLGTPRVSPFVWVLSQSRKFVNLMGALMMAVFMVIMISVYLLVLEDKDDYESRYRVDRCDA